MNAFPQSPLDSPPRNPGGKSRWKRIVAWILAGLGLLVVLAAIAVVVLLHSARFHQYVLKTVISKAEASLGTGVQVRDFSLRWSGGRPDVEIYGLAVQGAAPYQNTQVLTLDKISVGATITSFLHRTWYLNHIAVNHPVVRLIVGADGTNNIPKMKSSNNQSSTNIFDLGIRHATLESGEIYYNDRKSSLNADLHDLTLKASYAPAGTMYSGSLSYHNGHIELQNWRPIPHDLTANFFLTPTEFQLKPATLKVGRSQLVLLAAVQNYSQQPVMHANYHASLAAGEFRQFMRNPQLPSGDVELMGTIQYTQRPGVPPLKSVILNGDIASRELKIAVSGLRTTVRSIAGHYSLSNGNADVRDFRANLLGGQVTAAVTMKDLTGNTQSRMTADIRGLSIAQLKPMMNTSSLKSVQMAGKIDGKAVATWGKSLDNLKAGLNASVNGDLGVAAPVNPQHVPVNGQIQAQYSAKSGELSVQNSYLATPSTKLTLNGTAGKRSALMVHLHSSDLHSMEALVDAFNSSNGGPTPAPLGLQGSLDFAGTVRGSTAAPQIAGTVTATNLQIKGTSWKFLRTDVSASPSQARLQNGILEPQRAGRMTFDLIAGLHKWSLTKESPIKVNLNAGHLNAGDFAKMAGVQIPITGVLSAHVALQGSQLHPSGYGNVSLTNANVQGQQVQVASVKFQGTGTEVQVNVDLHTNAGSAAGSGVFDPSTRAYQAQVKATGIQLGLIKPIQAKHLGVQGVLNVEANGRGTLENPQMQAQVTVPKLEVQGQTINNLNVQADVANHVANVALNTSVINTQVRGRATIHLVGDFQTDAAFDTQQIPFAPLLAIYAPDQAQDIHGETEVHATVNGPLKDKNRLQAHITIPTLQASYQNTVQIGAAGPIRIDFVNGVLHLQRAIIRGTDTDLQMEGTFPTAQNQPISLVLLGTVNLRIAQMFDPDLTTSGQLRFNINSSGQRSDPNVEGQIQIVNANFATAATPIGLQNGNGTLTLTKDRLSITKFEGEVGGGKVTAQGAVLYRPNLRFDLALSGHNIRMLYPQGIRETFNVKLAFTGSPQSANLTGSVRLQQISFTPAFDLASFVSQFGGAAIAPPPTGIQNNIRLDLDLQSTSNVRLVSQTLSLQADASLRVTGTIAQPVLLGRVNLNGGDFIYRNSRFVVEGGTIDFVNPTETLPVLNVMLNTTIQQYQIHLRFDGPSDQLRTSYTSDPSLPPADIINLLAFGQTQEAAAASPSLPANQQAQSLIASGVANEVTSRISKLAGISQLSINPLIGEGVNQSPGAVITIQQRVTGNLFVTFSTDTTGTVRESIQVEYQVSPRTSVLGTRDQNGGFGIDVQRTRRW